MSGKGKIEVVKPKKATPRRFTKEETLLFSEVLASECQLGLTIYRLAHGVSFTTLEDLFGESESNCCTVFNSTFRMLVSTFYDRYVYLPRTNKEWRQNFADLLKITNFRVGGRGMASTSTSAHV